LLCVVIMFGLGIWQLERKAEKDIRLAQIEERKANRPYQLDELIAQTLPSNTNSREALGLDIQDYPVTVTGVAQTEQLFFIDNKIVDGKTGYQIVVPVLDRNNKLLLANLGWLRGSGLRGDLPTLSQDFYQHYAQQEREFSGVVNFPSDNKMISETNQNFGQFPVLLQQIDIAQMEQHLQASSLFYEGKVYSFVLNLADDPKTEFVRNWQAVVMSPEKHLGYAAQWFGLGIAALTIYLLSLMKLFQTKNKKEN